MKGDYPVGLNGLILTFDDEYIFRKFILRRGDIVTISNDIERATAISNRIGSWNWHHCCKFLWHQNISVRWWCYFPRCAWRVDRGGSIPSCSDSCAYRSPYTLTFSVILLVLHFTVLVTAWLLAVNTYRVFKSHFFHKIISLFSVKFPFRVLLSV